MSKKEARAIFGFHAILARLRAEPSSVEEILLNEVAEAPLLLVLDGVTDSHNPGACLRVANAGGAMW